MALDLRWVDAIHSRLLVRYGAKWLNLWNGVDPELVKTDWARELNGVTASAVQHAMENLPPDYPPTVAQFKAICARRPDPKVIRLSAPATDKSVVDRAIGQAKAQLGRGHPREWLYRLRQKEAAGEHLTAGQIHALKQTRGMPDINAAAPTGDEE